MLLLELIGDIDALTVPQLRAALTDLLAHGHRLVVLDLNRVAFLSAGGVNALLVSRAKFHSSDVSLRLARPSRAVLRPLTALGLARKFDIHHDVGRAVVLPRPRSAPDERSRHGVHG